MIRGLHTLGANLNTPNKYGYTPTYIAAQRGHGHIIRTLAEAGADLNVPNHHGWTPADVAAHGGQEEVVRMQLLRVATWLS